MTEAEWQKGYPLDQLKAFAEPFRQRHKPLVFGAFGLTKERDIAEAWSKNRMIWTGGPPQAVATFSHAKRDSEQQDFSQRSFVIPVGAVVVKAFAALSVDAGTKILKALQERAGDAAVVVEIFEEDAIAKECVAAAGLVYSASKISAGSEIKGVYTRVPFVPALPPEETATLRVLDPAFLSAKVHHAIAGELESAADSFAQHYSDYNKRKSWTAFALRGYSDDPTFIIKPSEMSKGWKEENAALLAASPVTTKAAPLFPATMKVVEGLGLPLDRVRFMRLRSKDGELSRHADITDREAGVQDGHVTRLHIPIKTSDAVMFYGWTARGEKIEVPFPERALCYLDQRKPHSVKNTDPALDRIHLVVDCFADAKLRKMIAKAETQAAA